MVLSFGHVKIVKQLQKWNITRVCISCETSVQDQFVHNKKFSSKKKNWNRTKSWSIFFSLWMVIHLLSRWLLTSFDVNFDMDMCLTVLVTCTFETHPESVLKPHSFPCSHSRVLFYIFMFFSQDWLPHSFLKERGFLYRQEVPKDWRDYIKLGRKVSEFFQDLRKGQPLSVLLNLSWNQFMWEVLMDLGTCLTVLATCGVGPHSKPRLHYTGCTWILKTPQRVFCLMN